jgi:hypothetical protein
MLKQSILTSFHYYEAEVIAEERVNQVYAIYVALYAPHDTYFIARAIHLFVIRTSCDSEIKNLRSLVNALCPLGRLPAALRDSTNLCKVPLTKLPPQSMISEEIFGGVVAA